MSEKDKDPAALWRDMLGDWEKNLNAFANKSMESEQFAKVMHQATGAGSGAQAAMTDVMQKYLSTMNLPSRADLTTIGERLAAIEAQLRRLTVLIHSMNAANEPAVENAPKPTRTRKPAPSEPRG
jgi:hypothetical protein